MLNYMSKSQNILRSKHTLMTQLTLRCNHNPIQSTAIPATDEENNATGRFFKKDAFKLPFIPYQKYGKLFKIRCKAKFIQTSR